MINNIANLVNLTLGYSTVLLLGSTGEMITEKSGNLNLGTPGIMCVGGVAGVVASYWYVNMVETVNPLLAILFTMAVSLIGSLLCSLIYSFLTITLKANQNVTGLALTTFGTGLSNFVGGIINDVAGKGTGISGFPQISGIYLAKMPLSQTTGAFGTAFLSSGFMTYMSIILAIIVGIVFTRTKIGLNLRAVGENPATADAGGINVTRYKYVATCVGGMISGLGGLHFVMQYASGGWNKDSIGQLGWLAVALVIFAMWRPKIGILGSVVFGALFMLGMCLDVENKMQKLLELLPYVVTLVVLIITSMRKKRELQPPQALGLPYFREER